MCIRDRKQLPLKLKSFGAWNLPNTPMEINYFTEVSLMMITSESFVETTIPLPDEFVATKLLVELRNFSSLNHITSAFFFSKFKNLKYLKVVLSEGINFDDFEILLNKNPIEKLVLSFRNDFIQFERLFNLIANRKLKHFRIEKDDQMNSLFPSFIDLLVTSGFWNEVETFGCDRFPVETAIFILQQAPFKKLRKVNLDFGGSNNKLVPFSKVLPTVREVNIKVNSLNYAPDLPDWLSPLLRMFPLNASLSIDNPFGSINQLNLSFLSNLRHLEIKCNELKNSTSTINSPFFLNSF